MRNLEWLRNLPQATKENTTTGSYVYHNYDYCIVRNVKPETGKVYIQDIMTGQNKYVHISELKLER